MRKYTFGVCIFSTTLNYCMSHTAISTITIPYFFQLHKRAIITNLFHVLVSKRGKMNNNTFKNILFVVPEKPFYKVLYAQTIIFRYFMD